MDTVSSREVDLEARESGKHHGDAALKSPANEPIGKLDPEKPPDEALRAYLRVRRELEESQFYERMKLWLRPAKLQRVVSGFHMLIALPPNNAIMRAAHSDQEYIRDKLRPYGYNMSFVRYATEDEKQQSREFYGVEVQTYGTAKPAKRYGPD